MEQDTLPHMLTSLEQGMTIKAGDVVMLKSGGPRMTVEAIDKDGVLCVWFDQNDMGKPPNQRYFKEVVLEHVPHIETAPSNPDILP
jgi:uncharacterized protein YodC (DUF2158 family)